MTDKKIVCGQCINALMLSATESRCLLAAPQSDEKDKRRVAVVNSQTDTCHKAKVKGSNK